MPQLGVSASMLTGKHCPCPLCGGKDRFRFDDKEGSGSWICSKCGAGDGVKLVMNANNIEFREAAERIEALIGSVEPDAAKPQMTEADRRAALNRLWRAGRPITPSDAAGLWLARRVGLTEAPPALRFVDRMRYAERGASAVFFPGMVAKVTSLDGKPATLHRTYLTPDGRKADAAEPRKLMAGTPPKGCSIRLSPVAETLGVAEGIETALAATVLHRVPCWAAINSSMLEGWRPPAGVRAVIVFGDNDTKFGGQAAAFALAHRLACDDRLGVTAEVRLPPGEGEDWNDVLLQQRAAA